MPRNKHVTHRVMDFTNSSRSSRHFEAVQFISHLGCECLQVAACIFLVNHPVNSNKASTSYSQPTAIAVCWQYQRSEHCIPVSSANTRRHLRSAIHHLLAVQQFSTYGQWAFSVAGPMVWNSLPDYIQDQTISAHCNRPQSPPSFIIITQPRYAA